MRYSELSRLLAGVSQKMLTQTLRSLERDGLITRTATPTVPVTVSYELTDLGLSLHQMMRGLKAWAEIAHGRCARQPRDVRHPHRLNRGGHDGDQTQADGRRPAWVAGRRPYGRC